MCHDARSRERQKHIFAVAKETRVIKASSLHQEPINGSEKSSLSDTRKFKIDVL